MNVTMATVWFVDFIDHQSTEGELVVYILI